MKSALGEVMLELLNGIDWNKAILALWALFEYWLGKTDRVKSNSTIELILALVRGTVKLIRKPKEG